MQESRVCISSLGLHETEGGGGGGTSLTLDLSYRRRSCVHSKGHSRVWRSLEDLFDQYCHEGN